MIDNGHLGGSSDWAQYRRLVLSTLERAEAELSKLREDLSVVKGRLGIIESYSLSAHIDDLTKMINEMQVHLSNLKTREFVTREEFAPISKLVWAIVLSTVTLIIGGVGALMSRGHIGLF